MPGISTIRAKQRRAGSLGQSAMLCNTKCRKNVPSAQGYGVKNPSIGSMTVLNNELRKKTTTSCCNNDETTNDVTEYTKSVELQLFTKSGTNHYSNGNGSGSPDDIINVLKENPWLMISITGSAVEIMKVYTVNDIKGVITINTTDNKTYLVNIDTQHNYHTIDDIRTSVSPSFHDPLKAAYKNLIIVSYGQVSSPIAKLNAADVASKIKTISFKYN